MILTFKKTYRYAHAGVNIVTYQPGDQIEVSADNLEMLGMADAAIASGHATEVKAVLPPQETKGKKK